MNTIKHFVISAIACVAMPTAGFAAVVPLPGINLGNTLESTWGYTAPTQALINSMAAAGFKTIRVPCSWNYNSTNGTINATYMTQVKNVVNWAIAKNMTVIINDHWDNGWFENSGFNSYDAALNTKLINLWTQVANNFKTTSSTQLLFACANEPAASTQAQTTNLYKYYQNWINAIRANGGNNATRWLVVQGPTTNIGYTCSYGKTMPTDSAKKLMIEVHFYDPYQFSLMNTDASWGSMFYFWGSGYKVTKSLTNRNATWGEESFVQSEFAKMKTNFKDRGYPVLIGEFRADPKPALSDLTGSYKTQNFNSASYWNKYVQNQLAAKGFDGTAWNVQNDLFNSSTGAILNQTMINAVKGTSAVAPISGL